MAINKNFRVPQCCGKEMSEVEGEVIREERIKVGECGEMGLFATVNNVYTCYFCKVCESNTLLQREICHNYDINPYHGCDGLVDQEYFQFTPGNLHSLAVNGVDISKYIRQVKFCTITCREEFLQELIDGEKEVYRAGYDNIGGWND